jgi:predicted RNA-binding protein with PIN domain
MTAARHLLVDGSNVMHAWPELKALLPRGRDGARSRLSRSLAALHGVEDIRVTLVFDGSGAELSVEQPMGGADFAHLHTPAGVTADEVIAHLVRRAKKPDRCVVASDDRAVRQSVEALGAATISTEDLAAWVQRAEGRQNSRIQAERRKNDQRWR